MKRAITLAAWMIGMVAVAGAEPAKPFNLADFGLRADGVTDDTPALRACFEAVAKAGGGNVVIPRGDYFVSGGEPIPLASNTTVWAYGANFILPKQLGDKARAVLFAGKDVHDFTWLGGHFQGYCFDLRQTQNTWEPNVNTRMIVITTSAGGRTDRLTFRDVTSDHVAGAVIEVQGLAKPRSESEVDTYASNITVENCTLVDSGKFMWDYGLLWQITVWPEDFSEAERAVAAKYFRNDLVREAVKMADGDDRVAFDNSVRPLRVSKSEKMHDGVCFYGDALPANLVRGKGYAVVESAADHVKIAERPGGEPIRFQGSAGARAKLIANLADATYGLYAPTGAGPGKGCVDITCARDMRISGCKLSALGDTMHVQRCRNVVFANNHIVGSRMGAFFLAEYCSNATIVGNTIDGTNGSRVMSVEKSARDVTIVGNTFRNGGRGSWINQPTNLILQGNVFVNNTTKCERDPHRGRRSLLTGDYEQYAELYFTTHEPGGSYGSVIVGDNIFTTGPEAKAAIIFEPGGSDVLVEGNIFKGAVRTVRVEEGCTNVRVGENIGLEK